MRNPNGYGTVYKLSGKRRRPYLARVPIGRADNGRTLYQTIGYFEKSEDALDALAKHRFAPVSPRSNITLKALYTEWSDVKYQYISRQLQDNYKAAWGHLSRYSNVVFKELRTGHLQSVVDGCYKAQKGKSTLQKIKILSSLLYDYAIQNDICNKNYAKFIKLPKFEKVEKEHFSEIEIKKIADSTLEWADTILILIYTGMRISEMLGLTIFNIDLENELITGGVKTEAGKNRTIPIHPKILHIIKKWYAVGGNRLICKDKKAISARKYRDDYYMPTLKAIGVRELKPHACRHTCATLLSKAGADPLYIQKILGHADYSTTANIYTHTDVDELKRAINMM
jgi:integrase